MGEITEIARQCAKECVSNMMELCLKRCCQPFKCIHEKIFHLSKEPIKINDCKCSLQLKLATHVEINTQFPFTSFGKFSSSSQSMQSRNNENFENKSTIISKNDRQKRPDKALYVPRALRDSPQSPQADKIIFHDDKIKKLPNLSEDLENTALDICTDISFECSNNFGKESDIDMNYDYDQLYCKNSNQIEFLCENSKQKILSNALESFSNYNISKVIHSDEKNSSQIILSNADHNLYNNLQLKTENSTNKNGNETVTDCNYNADIDKSTNILSQKFAGENNERKDTSAFNTDSDTISKLIKKASSECNHNEQNFNLENKDDTWESKFSDDGNPLNPDFLELCNITGNINVQIAENSYSEYISCDDISEEYSNIVEMYNFPVEFTTKDIVNCLSRFQPENYTIKWVDDCHTIIIFTNTALALQALVLDNPFFKMRPVTEGIRESKEKAKWISRNSEPIKPRPATSAALARRLVSSALGMKVKVSAKDREKERRLLNEEKERKRMKAKQKQEIWDGQIL